ncbi:MAG: acyl-CoA dehydrogenase family protein [Burkholderiales bacterium]
MAQATNTSPQSDEERARAGLATLVERSRKLVPVLKDRAAKTAKLRRLPDETVADLHDAGVFRCLQPRRVGGWELDYGCQLEIAAELGRGCGSTAWVAVLAASHHWLLGMFNAEAQDEVWGPSPDTLLSTSWGLQRIDAKAVPGGYRISGHWKFSSGVDHCKWAQVFVPVSDGNGGTKPLIGLIPKKDYRIGDAWFAHGLAGTGSNDIHIEDAFVPEHRTLDMRLLGGGPTPGSTVNPSHLYKLPLWSIFSFNLGSPAIGIARGVLESYIEQAKNRHSAIFDVKMVNLPTIQLRVAESSAEIDAAEAIGKLSNIELNRLGREGKVPTEFRVKYRRDTSYAAMICMRACDRLQAASGAHAIAEDNPIQRGFRDLRALNAQVAVIFDANAIPYGRVALGLDTGDPRI